jgi:hypothetical protein
MSLNVVAAWPLAIVCASDRRLVSLESGKIITNRATKLILFGCHDAHGIITYNGIGRDDSFRTPCDWLFDLQDSKNSFDKSLPCLLDDIRDDLTAHLAAIRSQYGSTKARHTFVCGAWYEGQSMIYGISNYEGIDEDTEESEGRAQATVTPFPPGPGQDIRVVTTGALSRLADRAAVAKAIKGHSMNHVKAAVVKIIRNAAFRSRPGRGTVSSAAQWAVVGADRNEVWSGFDVVGGAIALEPPNLINLRMGIHLGGPYTSRLGGPGLSIQDAYMRDTKVAQIGKYDPKKETFVFAEPKCGICGSPWPKAHRLCEVCTVTESREQHRTRRTQKRL